MGHPRPLGEMGDIHAVARYKVDGSVVDGVLDLLSGVKGDVGRRTEINKRKLINVNQVNIEDYSLRRI